MKTPTRRRPAAMAPSSLALSLALLLGGCASLAPAPARLALPEPLAATPAEPLAGLGGGREGAFVLGSQPWRYRRGANRLDLLERLGLDRATAEVVRSNGPPLAAHCRGRAAELTLGVLAGAVRPWAVDCRVDAPAGGSLALAAATGLADSAGLTRQARQGTITLGTVTLELRSLHALQGTPLPLAQPAGYVMLHRGQPVAALDLTDRTPRLHRGTAAAPDGELADAVALAAGTLAVLWDPASR